MYPSCGVLKAGEVERFSKLICSVLKPEEGVTYSVGLLERAKTSPTGQASSSVIYHRQNPLESPMFVLHCCGRVSDINISEYRKKTTSVV
jgi:hypothetical protein